MTTQTKKIKLQTFSTPLLDSSFAIGWFGFSSNHFGSAGNGSDDHFQRFGIVLRAIR